MAVSSSFSFLGILVFLLLFLLLRMDFNQVHSVISTPWSFLLLKTSIHPSKPNWNGLHHLPPWYPKPDQMFASDLHNSPQQTFVIKIALCWDFGIFQWVLECRWNEYRFPFLSFPMFRNRADGTFPGGLQAFCPMLTDAHVGDKSSLLPWRKALW